MDTNIVQINKIRYIRMRENYFFYPQTTFKTFIDPNKALSMGKKFKFSLQSFIESPFYVYIIYGYISTTIG